MTDRYAQIAVNIPAVSGVFDYHLPNDLTGQVAPGCLVVVPFGKQTVQGVVLRLIETSAVQQTRPIEAVLDPQPVLTPAQLALAHWMAEETLSPLAACLEGMLPPGLAQQAETLYQRVSNPPPLAAPQLVTPLQQRILDLLAKRGDLRSRQLDAAFPRQDWRASAQMLVKRGLLLTRPVLPPPTVRPKVVRTVQLTCPQEQIEARLKQTMRANTGVYARCKAILEFLVTEPRPVDVAWAYTAASGSTLADLERLAEAGLVQLSESEIWRDPLAGALPAVSPPPQLTADQMDAWQMIERGLAELAQGVPPPPFLLHGVTGSGKTELYLRSVQETLRRGCQAIILVPEIALTPQAVGRVLARFPGQVGLVHSRLSTGERYDTWRRARAGLLSVIVGPRSALFTPLPKLGLIVVDECHDDSYAQDEIPPFYNAVDTALAYGRLANCAVLLGSATPSVAQIYRANAEGWRALNLPRRVLAHRAAVQPHLPAGVEPPSEDPAASLELPAVRVVDMREEPKSGNRSIFSRALQDGLARVLAAGQQAILFLNRRGSSTYVFCRECGTSLKCPRCERVLTAHDDSRQGMRLICHTCGYTRQLPVKCPVCGSRSIRQYGSGTEKVAQVVLEHFPQARVLRWDADTAREKGAHEVLLAHFAAHRADVLVGTQMLAKGLDLPLVTLVGVVLAEVGLNLGDFRAGERTFQLLTQVAGRAGRSPLGGSVVLQTFQPEHYAIQAAARHDFTGFYAQELEYRRQMGYPPFSRFARLEFRSRSAEEAAHAAQRAAEYLRQWIAADDFSATDLIGAAPCFFQKQNGLYRWQVIVRGPNPAALLRAHLSELPKTGMIVQIDPVSLL